MMRIVIGIASLGILALIFIFTFSVLSPAAAEPTAGITALPFGADATPTPTGSPTPTSTGY